MVTLTDIPTYGTHRKHRRRLAAAVLLCAATVLTGCGDERPGTSAAPAPDPASASAAASASASPPPSPGASPYVEPGVVDGAPHNRENNAYRRPGEMSGSGRTDANTEVARMKPVLKRLWEAEKWDPESVRAELTDRLGYEDGDGGEGEGEGEGALRVQEMYSDYGDDNEYVTPEGAMIGLSVGEDSCVTAYVDKSGYGAEANGRFPETGCIRPPTGH